MKRYSADPSRREHQERYAATLASRQEVISDYFSRLVEDQRDKPHWAQGLAAVRQWIALTDDPNCSQDDVTSLLELMCQGASFRGTGWYDLHIQITVWAWQNGFDIPERSRHLNWMDPSRK